MFQISPSQSSQLAAQGHDGFLHRVAARIRGDFEAEFSTVDERDLRTRIRAAFDRFRALGFARKEHLHRLIVLELLYGPSFETALPKEIQAFAFDPSDNPAPEGERFWAIYRAADHLTRSPATIQDDPFTDLTFAVDEP